ncbi:hypothetical protein CAEBREN_17804 [Caenorhabditis brenneri]|uniref:Uncharacterized protein n=1 Tax=Caenorhabditis brenneri TaxID=135651 RepID=G0NNT4_CAEBE|nr:hypothetical protein CAEBREN_17804 [Caenorhabditis brenneri]
MLTGFGATEDLDVLGAVRRQMTTDHVGDVGVFLESCPHLDAKGMKMIMTPRGYVTSWVVSQIQEPTDRYFKKADAEQKKYERHEQFERRRLRDACEPPLVQKIKDLKRSMNDAEDPAKKNQQQKRREYPEEKESQQFFIRWSKRRIRTFDIYHLH